MWQYKVRFLLEVALKISTANFAKRIAEIWQNLNSLYTARPLQDLISLFSCIR